MPSNPPLQTDGRVGRPMGSLSRPPLNGYIVSRTERDVIFVLADDDCIHVYESVEDVVRSIEGLDAEESIRAAIDDNGRPYKIDWIEPNHYGRSFLGFRSVGSGRYTLVPSGPEDTRALFALLERDRPVFAGQSVVDAAALIARVRQLNAEA